MSEYDFGIQIKRLILRNESRNTRSKDAVENARELKEVQTRDILKNS